MNEPVSFPCVSGIKHLTAKSVVSLEMAIPIHEPVDLGAISTLKEIERDLSKTECLLVEMTHIRGAIETSLDKLNFTS
ncbi:MAG: hypothetical protein RR302_00515 [Victivallaceae bacterium]